MSKESFVLKPRKALNKAFLKVKPNRVEIEKFKTHLITLLDSINENESEEFHKNLVGYFLNNTYYAGKHFINTKGRNDQVIHSGPKADSAVSVIIEAKKPSNKSEMLKQVLPGDSRAEMLKKINTKAFQELVLYYLRERITHKNIEIKHIVATNIYEWFVFDATIFDKIFAQNKSFVKKFEDFENGRLSGTKTDFFYKEIAEPFIADITQDIEFTYFDFREYDKALRNDDKKDDTKLIALFKLLSPEHLLKLPFANDSNSLDKRFYTELLHIIGLEEVKVKNKKLIGRKAENNRDKGSIIENAITILQYEDCLSYIKAEDYGETKEERLYNVALELAITWINRILFLKLLEGQLIKYHNGDESYKFLSSKHISGYDALNKLFFQVLAVKQSDRSELIKEKFSHIPYLNSSLFEPNELEHKTIRISNLEEDYDIPIISQTVLKDQTGKKRSGNISALQYLFEFLDAYDFAGEGSEEIQEDNKTLINASVLGLIFEKINGYKDGSFFTPGFITMYMCRETIRRAVVQKFNEKKGWNCTDFKDLDDEIEDRNEANAIINDLKIVDPAVGSGHFLVSALNEIIAIKNDLKVLQDRVGRRLKEYDVSIENDELIITDDDGELFEYKPGNKESQKMQEALFHEKQTIIENCLFGVDINPNSVKICRLRLWIELLKNAYYKNENELETLPNIDINIKAGNSLVSRFALDADLKTALKKSSRYNIDAYRVAVSTYRNAKSKDEKRDMEKLITEIKGNFKSEISKTNKRFAKRAKLKGDLLSLTTQSQLFDRSEKEKATWDKQVKTVNAELTKVEAEIADIESNKIYDNAFEWRFEFPEALNDDGDFMGFDVVIGNPPYFLLSQLKESDHFNRMYSTFTKSTDISTLFYERGVEILKQGGLLTYITTNRFCNTNYGSSLRGYLSKKDIIRIANFNDIQIFEDANVNTLILEIRNMSPQNDNLQFKSISDLNQLYDKSHVVKRKHFKLNQWMFYSDEILDLKEKLDGNSVKFSELKGIFINRGVTTGANKIFIIDEKIKDELLNRDPNSIDLIKPILKGADIKRYYNKTASNWIIFTRRGTKIDNYPAIKDYLSGFKDDLTPGIGRKKGSYKWFEIQDNTAFYKEFEKRKIIWTRLSNINTFSISEDKEFTLDSSSFATHENSDYLCGVLNSKVVLFYFKLGAVIWGKDGIKWFGEFFDSIPIPHASDYKREEIGEIVKKILEIKKSSPNADIINYEKQIDQLVYELYGLTEDEIGIVEGSCI